MRDETREEFTERMQKIEALRKKRTLSCPICKGCLSAVMAYGIQKGHHSGTNYTLQNKKYCPMCDKFFSVVIKITEVE